MRRSGVIDEKTMSEFDELAGKRRPDEPTRIASRLNDALTASEPSELPRQLISEVEAFGVDRVARRLKFTPKQMREILLRKSRLSYQDVVLLLRGLGLRLTMWHPPAHSESSGSGLKRRSGVWARLRRRSPINTKKSVASVLRRIRGK